MKWLDKKSFRQVYWFWLHITRHLGITPRHFDMPDSPGEIFKMSIRYLNQWEATNFIEGSNGYLLKVKARAKRLSDKINYINTAKLDWKSVASKKFPYKFLKEKNEVQKEWAFKYINDFLNEKKDFRFNSALFEASTQQAFYHQHVAFLDVWPIEEDAEKELFIIKMKRAWAQKKYRDSLTDHVICTLTLRTSTKDKLAGLAKSNGLNLNETITWLIDKELKKKK